MQSVFPIFSPIRESKGLMWFEAGFEMTVNQKDVWIGFDLGGTKMLSVAYGPDWKELGRKRRKTRAGEKAGEKVGDKGDAGIDRIGATIDRLLEECELSRDRIAGIGIGCPGPIDLDEGRVTMAPNLGWDDVNVADFLKKRFDCPAVVLNDVDAGVFGEYTFGAAKGARCAVGIFPGTGVGGGCVYQGRIFVGGGLSCMEIGHTRISGGTRTSGYELTGTVEAEASRLAIAAEASKAAYRGDAPFLFKKAGTNLAEIRSGALAESIEKGDKAIEKLVESAAEVIGIAVVNIVHLLAPDKIVLGGGLVEAMEDLMVGTVTKTARKHVMAAYRDCFEIVPAKLGDDAGVLGAAAWAKQELDAKAET
jgi:glucokinase